MRTWEKQFPGRVDHVFAALGRLVPSHLMDRKAFDFQSLTVDDLAVEGDIAFDPPAIDEVRVQFMPQR
jgi:tRNA 2-thiocytidine biosynthesis protein TtcA